MNATYPVREGANRTMMWLLAAAVLMAGLFLALRAVNQTLPVRVNLPVVTAAGQAVPQVVPVPEPPQNRPAPYRQAHATPVPPGAQLPPEPQPGPTPPTGH